MFGPLLSVLLLGMLPVATVPPADQAALSGLSIAAPLPPTASASTLLDLSRRVSATGAIIADLDSGQMLFGKHARRPRAMGSLTKLMTALLIAEHHRLDEVVTVPEGIEKTVGSVVHLRAGERFTVGDLLTALLVPSANDAAQTLAIFHSGSIPAFVAEMNERARILGLRNTSYANPAGLDDPQQWSTPQDLAWLAAYVLRVEPLRERLSLPRAEIRSGAGRVISFESTHALLREPGPVVAGKTGTTEEAGQCLLSIVQEKQRAYVVVLLGSQGRYADMHAVLGVLGTLFL